MKESWGSRMMSSGSAALRLTIEHLNMPIGCLTGTVSGHMTLSTRRLFV